MQLWKRKWAAAGHNCWLWNYLWTQFHKLKIMATIIFFYTISTVAGLSKLIFILRPTNYENEFLLSVFILMSTITSCQMVFHQTFYQPMIESHHTSLNSEILGSRKAQLVYCFLTIDPLLSLPIPSYCCYVCRAFAPANKLWSFQLFQLEIFSRKCQISEKLLFQNDADREVNKNHESTIFTIAFVGRVMWVKRTLN